MKNVVAVQLLDAQREAEQLSTRKMDKQAEARFQFLMSKIKTLREGIVDEGEDSPESRAREERAFMRNVLTRTDCFRTYVPLASSGSAFVAQQFEKRVADAMATIGPFYSDSPLVTNIPCEETESGPSKMPTSEDTTSTGYVVDESAQETDVNPTLSNVTLSLQKFSSGMILYSMELGQDSFEATSQVLSTSLGRRISRIQNSTFTTALLTALGANSSASLTSSTAGIISVGDVEEIVAAVSSVYRQSSKAAFVMSASAQRCTGVLKTSGGLPIFPDVLSAKPTLLGYPCHISAYLDTVASGNTPLIFGDFSTVYIRSLRGLYLRTLTERYIDQGSYAVVMHKRAAMAYGIQSTSDSAIKMLTIASS